MKLREPKSFLSRETSKWEGVELSGLCHGTGLKMLCQRLPGTTRLTEQARRGLLPGPVRGRSQPAARSSGPSPSLR
jgi:hypothetical protein